MAATRSARSARTQIGLVAFADIGRSAVKWGALVLIARYAYLAIAVLAGRTTLASIVVNFLANLKLSEGVCYIVTVGSIAYGIGQQQLRRRAISRLAEAKNALEKIMDPKRTSSELTSKGKTRPGDKR